MLVAYRAIPHRNHLLESERVQMHVDRVTYRNFQIRNRLSMKETMKPNYDWLPVRLFNRQIDSQLYVCHFPLYTWAGAGCPTRPRLEGTEALDHPLKKRL